MSFGLAFVQGLVGGFQKNIDREQTARDADDKRLAGLQDTLFATTAKAAAEGKPVPKQLGEMLSKAKTDVGNRPDIGLFGTGKADRLNLDFTSLAGTINGVSNFGRVYGTPETYQLGFKAKNVYDEKNSRNFVSEAVSLTRNEIGLSKLRLLKTANPTAYKEFVSAIQSSSLILRNKAKEVNPNQDKNLVYKTRNIKNEQHPFFGIDKIYEIDAGEVDEVSKTGSVDSSRITSINDFKTNLKKQNKPIPSFMTIVDGDENNDKFLSLSLTDSKDLNQAKKMSANFNIAQGGNVFDYWHNKHVTLPGMKNEDKTLIFFF